MNKTSKVIVVLVLALVVLFGVGQFFALSGVGTNTSPTASTTSEGTTAPTQVVTFTAIAPASGTVPIENGSCFAGSIAAPFRSDAWRCAVGNSISDPCFQIGSSTKQLLCGVNPAEGPYATSTFILNLTSALPKNPIPSGPIPSNWAWAVELADGTYCAPFTGTRPFTASGIVAIYGCTSPNASENLIFGDLNASSSAWVATVGSFNTSTSSLPTVGYSIQIPVLSVWQ